MTAPIDDAAIDRAVEVLQRGGLVAIPTETVYGLAADADNREAVLATFAVKHRPTWHPLIVHVAGIDDIAAWADHPSETALALAEKFWPGPLTMVLPKSERCGDFVTGGQTAVAVRCPSHPWCHELLVRFGAGRHKGVTAPSCNTFGHISPTTAQHVRDDLGVKPTGKLDYILDGGPCDIGVESTIINLAGPTPSILRHGAITREMLEDFLGRPVPDAGKNAPRASGNLKSHYAPNTKAEMVDRAQFLARVAALADQNLAVMASQSLLKELPGNVIFTREAPATEAAYAHCLYEYLHELDAAGADRILIERPPQTPSWAAVDDRLNRACADKNQPVKP